jgi:hypothetical protein
LKRYLTIALALVVLFSFQVQAERSVGNDGLRYINDRNNTGALFLDEEIELNDFRIMPVFEDIGLVSDPEYFFEKSKDFPLGHHFFILKIEDRAGDKKYVPVKFHRSGVKTGNRYWIYRARTYYYGSRVDIYYEFTKKEYLKDKSINFLELVVTVHSENRLNTELEYTNYFLANKYIKGKGVLHTLSNYNENEGIYDNVIIKRWQGRIKQVYNVRTFQGEERYESIEFMMKSSVLRKGSTNRIGKIDLFYNQSESTKEAMKYFEDLLY